MGTLTHKVDLHFAEPTFCDTQPSYPIEQTDIGIGTDADKQD